jgi:hypothetical protein
MAGGFRGIMVSVIMVILFSFSLLIFATSFITENNPTSPILNNNNVLNYTKNFQTSMNQFSNSTNAQLAAIQPGSGGTTYSVIYSVFLIIPAALTIPLNLFSLITGGITLIGSVVGGSLGFTGDSSSPLYLVVGIIVSVIFVTAMLLFIKFIRGGESER